MQSLLECRMDRTPPVRRARLQHSLREREPARPPYAKWILRGGPREGGERTGAAARAMPTILGTSCVLAGAAKVPGGAGGDSASNADPPEHNAQCESAWLPGACGSGAPENLLPVVLAYTEHRSPKPVADCADASAAKGASACKATAAMVIARRKRRVIASIVHIRYRASFARAPSASSA